MKDGLQMTDKTNETNTQETSAQTTQTTSQNVDVDKLKAEAAGKGKEVRALKREIDELKPKLAELDKIPALTTQIAELTKSLNTQREEAEKAKADAARANTVVKFKLPAEAAKALEFVPVDKLEEVAQGLAKATAKPEVQYGWTPAVGASENKSETENQVDYFLNVMEHSGQKSKRK